MSMSSSNSKIKKQYTTLPASQPQLTRERSVDNLLHRGLNARRASLNASLNAAGRVAHGWPLRWPLRWPPLPNAMQCTETPNDHLIP